MLLSIVHLTLPEEHCIPRVQFLVVVEELNNKLRRIGMWEAPVRSLEQLMI